MTIYQGIDYMKEIFYFSHNEELLKEYNKIGFTEFIVFKFSSVLLTDRIVDKFLHPEMLLIMFLQTDREDYLIETFIPKYLPDKPSITLENDIILLNNKKVKYWFNINQLIDKVEELYS